MSNPDAKSLVSRGMGTIGWSQEILCAFCILFPKKHKNKKNKNK